MGFRTFGIESEYASNAEQTLRLLYEKGFANDGEMHRYHCDCNTCDFGSDAIWRGQHDSTVNGELISTIFSTSDWNFALDAIEALCSSARDAGATTSTQTGVHVHVSRAVVGGTPQRSETVALAYFLTERYFTEIVAPGNSRAKREMNRTLLQAFRSYVAEWGDFDRFVDANGLYVENVLDHPFAMGYKLMAAIGQDRHVDLNIGRRLPTYEFRVFNGTLAEWRMELNARISVAFIDAAHELVEASLGDDSVTDLIRQGHDSDYTTKRPTIHVSDFVDILSRYDDKLPALIERQAAFMRTRYAKQIPAPAPHE